MFISSTIVRAMVINKAKYLLENIKLTLMSLIILSFNYTFYALKTPKLPTQIWVMNFKNARLNVMCLSLNSLQSLLPILIFHLYSLDNSMTLYFKYMKQNSNLHVSFKPVMWTAIMACPFCFSESTKNSLSQNYCNTCTTSVPPWISFPVHFPVYWKGNFLYYINILYKYNNAFLPIRYFLSFIAYKEEIL
jgi:hypothetical protein